MRIEYDDEANQISDAIHERLRALGFTEFSEGGLEVQNAMEQSVLDALSAARRDIDSRDLVGAMRRLFLPDQIIVIQSATGPVDMSRDDFERFARSANPLNRERLAGVLLDALNRAAPGEVYSPTIPFNVVAALDAMFRAIVVPRRLFGDAQTNCRRQFQVDLVIQDDDGTVVYDQNVDRDNDGNETGFWELVELFIDRWNMRSNLTSAVIELKPVVAYLDVSYNINALINNIYLERAAA